MGKRSFRAALAAALLALLGACGGGGGDGGSSPAAVDPGSAPVIGSAGGTVSHASGASVIVPAGAIQADTTIRIAMDSTGAPALPTGLTVGGSIYVITPHGGEFPRPVEVRIPASSAHLGPNQELKLAKAQPGGTWEVLDSTLMDGMLSAKVSSFSFFMPVVITYLVPIAQAEPWRAVVTLSCGEQDCNRLVGSATVTLSWTTNNGQLPDECASGERLIVIGTRGGNGEPGVAFPVTSGSITRTYAPTFMSWRQLNFNLVCNGSIRSSSFYDFYWRTAPYPSMEVLRTPAQVDVVAGLRADIEAVLAGGAAKQSGGAFVVPTPANRAVVDWQRSDDNGASWRPIARSFQNEADPHPLDSDSDWRYWGVHHGFVAATSDQGALIRVQACYTPPDVPAPPCVTGPATRLNVLQQSALPAIVDAPRSVLVKAGQTASFSATAQGAPAPTTRWQTRPANATGAWTDVSGGTGAGTGNYTTPVLTTADNGTQYRAVASNALGSAESAAVTVSVSDLDVAPTITTHPGNMSVTAGSDAAFAIAARGTEALSYQWQFNGATIPGATSPVLRLPAVAAAQAGNYTVTVTNAAGTATSNPATLAVGAASPGAIAPTIVTQPVSVLINAGNTATFAVGVSGSSPIAYQWTRDAQPIPGATAAFYSIAQAAIGDAATYRVQVSNGVGPAVLSDNVILTVNANPLASPVVLTTQPSPQVQVPGGSATFAVAATGSGPIAYQWLKNGAPIAGATSAVLSFGSVTGSDAASYAVTVNNALNTVTSNGASLVVLGAPVITGQPAAVSAAEGSTATFSVSASGSLLRYQWTRNGVAIPGAVAAGYTTPALALADSGAVFAVVVYNGAGVAFSGSAVLTVTPAPVLTAATMVSVSTASVMADNASSMASVSADGRVIAFTSTGTNLVPRPVPQPTENGHAYVRNLVTGVTTLINQTPAGAPSSRGVVQLKLSADGRHAIFTSLAGDLVAGDTNGSMDVFVRDLAAGITTRVSVMPDGSQITGAGNAVQTLSPSISADGRWVAFSFSYDLLVTGGPLPTNALYLRDMATNSTRVAVSNPTYMVGLPVLSDDASRIVYLYAVGSQNVIGSYDVATDTTDPLITVDTTVFPEGIGPGLGISGNGRYVAFGIRSAAWIPAPASAITQVLVVDSLNPGSPVIASTGAGGIGDGPSGYPVLSGDGRYVLFQTNSPSLTGDPAATLRNYLMVRDLVAGTTTVASRRPNGTPVQMGSGEFGTHALSADGSVVAWVAQPFDMGIGAGEKQVYAAPRP